MRNSYREISIVLSFLFLLWAAVLQGEPNDFNVGPTPAESEVIPWLIPCKGLIDDGLYKSIRRRTEKALDEGAQYLIYEISTYGGLLQSADDISKYFILEVGKKARTVAYVTTEAISAGAMMSVSCEDIIMVENTTIGDCAPITLPGKELKGVEREKAESFTRAAFDRASEANHYPQALLRAMVTMQIEVYRVKNVGTGGYEFFEGARLPQDVNAYDLDNKELIVKDDEILTLTASKAHEYGVARAVVGDLAGALEFLAARDGVTFAASAAVLETNWSEKMVRWLNHPAVMSVLIMLALLGVYVEFNTPGVGLPGLVAVICFTIIIGSKYLVGLANWVEVALFVVGVILLLIEIFVLPGFGIAGLSGIACILLGLFGMLVKNAPERLPWPETQFEWEMFSDGVLGFVFGFVGFMILAWLLAKYLPRLEYLSGLILAPTAAKKGDEFEVCMTRPAEAEKPSVGLGDSGEVVSTLRPAGRVKFGDCIVDCVAEGDFLAKGTKVTIVEIHGNRVVVKGVANHS